MLLILFNIFIIFITLFVLIGFHEWGHFIVARKLGISVERFSIGFGKILWKKKIKDGPEYAFCVFPLGGYVKFKDQSEFDHSPIYKRFLIIFAGPFFNLVFAFLAYWIVFVIGIFQPIPMTTHGEIIAVDQHPTATWPSVVFKLIPHLGKSDSVFITTSDQGNISTRKILLHQWKLNPLKPDLLRNLGITPVKSKIIRLRQFSLLGAIPEAFKEVSLYFQLNSIILSKILTGTISVQSLVGPIGLFSGTLVAAHQGLVIYLAFLGFISIGIAFANLLPIPGLDGAHILFLGLEIFRGKPLSNPLQVLLFKLGIILLSLLMFQALVNDIVRLL
jgi:regulator of sigma E protease